MHILIQNLTNPQNIYTHFDVPKKFIIEGDCHDKKVLLLCIHSCVTAILVPRHKEEEFVCSSGILGSERVRDTSF